MAENNSKIEQRIKRKNNLADAYGVGSITETSASEEKDSVGKPANVEVVQNATGTANIPVEEGTTKPTVDDIKEAQQVIGVQQEITAAYSDMKANAGIEERSTGSMAEIPETVMNVFREYLRRNTTVSESDFEGILVDEKKLAEALVQSLGDKGLDMVPIVTNALMKKNSTAEAYIAQCLPKSVKKCRECMFREGCDKCLVKYPYKRLCISLPSDVAKALDMMLDTMPEYRNMTKSSLITTLLRRQVEACIPAARKQLDADMLMKAKLDMEADEKINELLRAMVK